MQKLPAKFQKSEKSEVSDKMLNAKIQLQDLNTSNRSNSTFTSIVFQRHFKHWQRLTNWALRRLNSVSKLHLLFEYLECMKSHVVSNLLNPIPLLDTLILNRLYWYSNQSEVDSYTKRKKMFVTNEKLAYKNFVYEGN